MKKQTTEHTNRLFFILQIGFFAGLIWGIVKIISYSLNFTKVIPGFLIKPFFKNWFLISGWGYAAGLLTFIVMSIAAAAVYMLCLSKLKGPWPGIAYGMVWWVLLYMIVGPIARMMQPIFRLDLNSIITDLCIFLLWGAFIGYTVSFEYTDERMREPFSKG
jgi:uncharacterized membrane protein YagU involved in acid resistance